MTRQEKLAAQQKLIDKNFETNLEEKQEDIEILENIKEKISKITKKEVIDTSWLGPIAGRLSGILSHIMFNPKFKKDILIILKLKESVLVKFMELVPILSYINKDKEVIEGQEGDITEFKNLLLYLANYFNVILEADELNKITKEKYENLENRKKEQIAKTLDLFNGIGFKYDE